MNGRLLSVGCAAIWLGCTDVSSADLKTQGITARLLVAADGTGATTSTAVLNVDTNLTDFVQLASGDTLVTDVSTQSEPMASENVGGVITYSAAFTGQDAPGTQYTVVFNRAAGNASAPASVATIPQPFNISPLTRQTFSRANDDIVLQYATSGSTDQMSWSISGSCLNVLAGQTLSGDPGTFTITKGSLVSKAAGGDQNCQATLTLTRAREGTLDPAYGGGSIYGQQQRSVTFTSSP